MGKIREILEYLYDFAYHEGICWDAENKIEHDSERVDQAHAEIMALLPSEEEIFEVLSNADFKYQDEKHPIPYWKFIAKAIHTELVKRMEGGKND